MLIAGLMIAILFGWVRGGSLTGLARLPIRHIYLLILALLLELVQSQMLMRTALLSPLSSFAMTILQYLLIFIFVYMNLHMWEVLVYGAGTALNFIAISANAGAMPLTPQILSLGGSSAKYTALIEGRYLTYRIIDGTTRLPWLGDIILIPGPLPQCISVGDIVLVIGVFCLVARGMTRKKTEKKQA